MSKDEVVASVQLSNAVGRQRFLGFDAIEAGGHSHDFLMQQVAGRYDLLLGGRKGGQEGGGEGELAAAAFGYAKIPSTMCFSTSNAV